MTYTICEPCIDVKDRACVDECPVDCIYEGPRMLYIQPDECVDCGACEPSCPVTAIFYEDDVPAEWKQFTAINAEWFEDGVSGVGSPGGAAQVGPAGTVRRSSPGARAARRVRCPLPRGEPRPRSHGRRPRSSREPGCVAPCSPGGSRRCARPWPRRPGSRRGRCRCACAIRQPAPT